MIDKTMPCFDDPDPRLWVLYAVEIGDLGGGQAANNIITACNSASVRATAWSMCPREPDRYLSIARVVVQLSGNAG